MKNDAAGFKFEVPPTDDYGKVVDVILQENNGRNKLMLSVPEAYLSRSMGLAGGQREYLWIRTILPTLEPNSWKYTRSKIRKENGLPTYFKENRNQVSITLNHRVVHEKTGDRLREMLEKRFQASPSRVHGLVQYSKLKCELDLKGGVEDHSVSADYDEASKCRRPSKAHYYTPNHHGRWMRISCFRDRTDPSAGCEVLTTYKGRKLTYFIRQSELAYWTDIDSGVAKLLDSFVVEQ